MNKPMDKRFFDYYICPNSGETVEALKEDDKMLCPCGKSNPAAASEEHMVGHRVLHFTYLLKKV